MATDISRACSQAKSRHDSWKKFVKRGRGQSHGDTMLGRDMHYDERLLVIIMSWQSPVMHFNHEQKRLQQVGLLLFSLFYVQRWEVNYACALRMIIGQILMFQGEWAAASCGLLAGCCLCDWMMEFDVGVADDDNKPASSSSVSHRHVIFAKVCFKLFVKTVTFDLHIILRVLRVRFYNKYIYIHFVTACQHSLLCWALY